MITGSRTYLTLITLGIYNIALPWLGIKDVSMDAIDTAVNVILLIAAAIFRKIAILKTR